jgi:signal transduction histidine kinase
MTEPDAEVLLYALGYSGATATAGVLAVRFWPGRSVRGALFAVPLVAVASVIAGIAGAAQAMFFHDLPPILLGSTVASIVALASSWTVARLVVTDVAKVSARARALADPDGFRLRGNESAPPRLRELAVIDAEFVDARNLLTQARRREAALEQSRRELVAWVSHDLRTPLAGMRAMAEALEDGVAPDPARYHRQIRREVDRLSRMVDDLFELSRIRAGGLSLTLENVDLRDLVSDVVSGTSAMATVRGVALAAEADPASLRADAAGLGRVLTNLVVNAIRHTPADGTVHVAAVHDGGDIVVSVTDACGGIPDGDLDNVFEPGWRGTQARTPSPDGGAGLGLAIARGIVEAHQGRISVRNTDHGCRFDVRLPVVSR